MVLFSGTCPKLSDLENFAMASRSRCQQNVVIDVVIISSRAC